ncbi:hypothetical protein [Methylobacterium mesophilicum]
MAPLGLAEGQATGSMPKQLKDGPAKVRLPMVVSEAFAERLDAFRSREPGVPNRSEAIRILVNEALEARERTKPRPS